MTIEKSIWRGRLGCCFRRHLRNICDRRRWNEC